MSDISSLPYRPCVGIMAINRAGMVWIGRRVAGRRAVEGVGQWWQMPQGGLDPGESAREAALRELGEETGMHSVEVVGEGPRPYRYDLPADLVPHTWGGRFRGQEQTWFAIRFLGPDSEIDISGHGGMEAEFDSWRWARLDELVDLIVPFKRDVYARAIADLAPFVKPLAQ